MTGNGQHIFFSTFKDIKLTLSCILPRPAPGLSQSSKKDDIHKGLHVFVLGATSSFRRRYSAMKIYI